MPIRFWSLLIAASVFVLDRISKVLIERHVSIYDTLSVIPGFFNIVHTKNAGAAFGMFAEGHGALRTFMLIGVSAAVLVFISILLLRPSAGGLKTNLLTTVALSLVLGGALGNIYDRVAYGTVTDFLEFYWREYRFAAFNVADSAITTGAGLLLLDMWKTRKEPVRP
ncbi:MAG TPA: signal peptidase II [Bryobacteraceae bacterium]|nr:signal peptidase II [Bryobacteraceae bacterium]